MRIFLILCILIGILIPTAVIYVDQKEPVNIPVKLTISDPIAIVRPVSISNYTPPTTIEITPEATPKPVYVIKYVLEPTIICSECANIEIDYTNIQKPTGNMIFTRCTNARLLKDRDEVYDFMVQDDTNLNPFVMGQYQCIDYAEDVIENAAHCGIKCGIGIVYFTNGNCHSFIVFPTIDDGDVWVDPTAGDWWIEIDGSNNWKSINMYDSSWSYFNENRTIGYIERISY